MRLCRLRRAALTASLLAGPAAAAGEPLVLSGPPDGSQLRAGAAVALRARGVAGDSGLELHVSSSPQPLDACGRIGADVVSAAGLPEAGDPAVFDFPTGPWYDRAGTYYWQVSRIAPDGSCAATEVRRLTLTAVTAARPELAGLSHELIPRGIGHSNGASYIIRTGDVPPSVGRARFLALVRNSGRRWRLHSHGAFPGRPVFGNGRSEVGFSSGNVPRQALAVTIIDRTRRAGGLERDLILRADVPWQPGPDHPTGGRVDLETVLLHELGHVAGNRRHVPRGCHNTPMVVGLSPGEWWRSTGDFFYRACLARA